MRNQATALVKLVCALIFLGMSTEAASVAVSHNTVFSGTISRSETDTTIKLALAPVLVGYSTKGTDGPISAMIKNSGGMATNPAKIAEYTKMGKSIKDSQIRISIPLIDYGYTGTLNNACIKLKGKNGDKYEARKLAKKSYCIGTVTIENYTRFELKGSYSGGLTNLNFEPEYPKINSQVNGGFATGVPINFPPVGGSIKGSFYILDPWRHDPRFGFNEDAMIDAAESDLKGMVAEFGIDADIDGMFDKARANKRSKSTTSSVVGSAKACDCSCNYVTSATSVCKVQCEEVFAACTAAPYKPPAEDLVSTSNTPPPSNSLPKVKGPKLQGIDQEFVDKLEKGEIETPTNLRAEFISKLQKYHSGEAKAPMRDMMIKAFDSMPDDKAKLVMLKGIEGN